MNSHQTNKRKMTTSLITQDQQSIARPLKILIPIIQTDLEDIESAELPLKIKVGGELVEAKQGVDHGEWAKWLKKNFELAETTARIYMGMWEEEQNESGDSFSSVGEFKRLRAKRNEKTKRKKKLQADRNGLESADRLFKEEKLRYKLAIELVDAGYKSLSNKYHPDKGGDSETMRRLTEVRKTLKGALQRKEIAFR